MIAIKTAVAFLSLAIRQPYAVSFSSEEIEQHPPQRTWRKEEYPNPKIHSTACRSNTGLICDPDSILPTTELQQLESKLLAFTSQVYENTPTSSENVQIKIYVALLRKVLCRIA
jgi:Modulator of levamisole receptor-1